MGEHRLMEKNMPYEPALRIPFLVRGPGLPAGGSRRALFGIVDLAPRILELTGVAPGRRLDGVSMVATLRTGGAGYRWHLIQAADRDLAWWWRGIRLRRYAYVRYVSGTDKLYDLRRDPGEERNVASRPAYPRSGKAMRSAWRR